MRLFYNNVTGRMLLLCMAFVLFVPGRVFSQQLTNLFVRQGKGTGLYISGDAGFCLSLAENSSGADLKKNKLPSIGATLGYNFSPVWGVRVSGGILSQVSKCSESAVHAMPGVYGDGTYRFRMLAAGLSLTANMSNMFGSYDDCRTVSFYMLAGGGIIRVKDFERDKIDAWNQYEYYPVCAESHSYPTAHIGVQCGVRVAKDIDVTGELKMNVTDNAYNGVDNGGDVDFYLNAMLGVKYYFKPRKDKNESFRRAAEPYIDPLVAEDRDEGALKKGATMRTTVPFYIGFYYLNTETLKKISKVAGIMKRYPDMKICVIGHPDMIEGHDERRNLALAQNRADEVKRALVEKYHVSERRIRTEFNNEPLVSLRSVGEWIPAVSFVME